MSDFTTAQIVTGILECDPATKQELGRRLATHLHLQEGVVGRDDGIDGIAVVAGKRILFQAKLSKEPIGADFAKVFCADLIRHRMTTGIYLAGVAYTADFHRVFTQLSEILRELGKPTSGFFLTLADVLDKTKPFIDAARILPPMSDIERAIVPLAGQSSDGSSP